MKTTQHVIDAWEKRLEGANQHLLSLTIPKKLADATLRELTTLVTEVERLRAALKVQPETDQDKQTDVLSG